MRYLNNSICKLAFFLITISLVSFLINGCKKREIADSTISGTVINALSNEPIDNVTITLTPNEQTTTTDQDGKFLIENLTPQTYVVQYKKDGFETSTKSITALGGTNIKADIALMPLIPILNVAEKSLNFGKTKSMLWLTISNKGKGTVDFQISIPPSDIWLSANPKTWSIANEIKVVEIAVTRNGMAPAYYSTEIAVTSNAGLVQIPVTMIVQGPVPTAYFQITPAGGSTAQIFTMDPTGSTDDKDSSYNLLTRVRWEDPGQYTDWTTMKTYQHQYIVEGAKSITLDVKDSDGNVGTVTKSVLVSNSMTKPTVNTSPVTNIGGTSATCGGTVVNDGGLNVTERGICWSTNQNPTVADAHVTLGSGVGVFGTSLTGLAISATYFVKAYAINNMGIAYGNEVSFTTSFVGQPPTVSTDNVTNVMTTTANCGGNVSVEGSSPVTVRGVCWSTSQNPTTSDQHSMDGQGVGQFTSQITGLSPTTKYYIRAYATNSYGTSYGNQVYFTTPQEIVTDYDGNIYYPVQIGSQIWLDRNLNTTHYQNGDPISLITDQNQWVNSGSGAYCHYENNPENAVIYGKLYNWFAATDIRKVCPNGWHVPTKSNWETLFGYLGGVFESGGKMKAMGIKENGTGLWNSPNTAASNLSGFSAIPAGERSSFASWLDFTGIGYSCSFWSSSLRSSNTDPYMVELQYNSAEVITSSYPNPIKVDGLSLRCVKD